jgi:predicted O-methyltransferase YrrM
VKLQGLLRTRASRSASGVWIEVPPIPPFGEGWRDDLPGMHFTEFYERFGASCRTKNTIRLPSTVRGRARLAVRLLLGRVTTTNRRLHSPPARSALPYEFIRLDPWEAGYLFAIAQAARRGIVEIGRFRGGSTFLLGCANRKVPIWSIDLAPSDDDRLRQLLIESDVGENVELLVGDSQQGDFPQVDDFDLVFVDGQHTREGCRADLERFYPRLALGGHVLVHDCYAEQQVQQAVLDFVAAHDVTILRSPYIPNAHWHTSAGSIAHLTKPLDGAQAVS